jgi:hypothetical protein
MLEDGQEGLTIWCDYCSCFDETFDVEEEYLLTAMSQAGWGTRQDDDKVDHMCPNCVEEGKPW